MAVNSEGILAVADEGNKCVHLLTKEGVLVKSIERGVFAGRFSGASLCGVVFDLKGNIWVADSFCNKVVKVTQDGQLLHKGIGMYQPYGVAVSPEGLLYACDTGNCRVTVYDEEGNFKFAFGSRGCIIGKFNRPLDVAYGSDGLLYVTDNGNRRVCSWSKEGTFKRDFQTKYDPTYIAATSDNHLLITSLRSHIVMVYTLEGELVHEFGGRGFRTGKFNRPWGICVDDSGVVYVADAENRCVQVF